MSRIMLSDDELDSLGFTFIWRIENFSHCLEKKDSCIKSPNFCMISNVGETAWYLQVFPRGKSDNDLIGYNLCKERLHGTNCIKLDYKISIVASDGSLRKSIECRRCWFHQGATCLEEHVMTQDELFGEKRDFYLPQDTLTFHCHMWESFGERSCLGQSFARTRIGVEKKSVIWKIKEFSALQVAQLYKTYVTASLKEELSLSLCLKTGLESDKHMEIAISEADTTPDNLTYYKIALLDSKGSQCFSTSADHWFEKKKDSHVCSFPILISKSSLMAKKSLYLPNDTLSIQSDYAMSIGVVYSELEHTELGPFAAPHVNSFLPEVHQHRHGKESVVKITKASDSLKDDLLNLYNKKAFCDFELKVGSETIPVHKTILGARSPVFCSMLLNNMIEKRSNTVDINDLDFDTVKRMLHFMYTESIEDLQWEESSKLYFAADKYGIESLKQKCSSFLVSNLNTLNVCKALELSDLHQDNALKAAAMEFVFWNDEKVLLSSEWMQLLKHKSQLAAELMHGMYLKKIGQSDK